MSKLHHGGIYNKSISTYIVTAILVVLHELGVYSVKIFKTRVKFYLFFDVKFLYLRKIGETVYGIGWLPLVGMLKYPG